MTRRFLSKARLKIKMNKKNPVGNTIVDSEMKGYDQMIDRIALILAIIGGINWGSVGLFKFDLVAWICGGQTSLVSRIIYTIVGLASIWCISLLFRESNDSVGDHNRE